MFNLRYIGLGALFLFLAFGFLSPNPFGNNPDVIADESYFLTSSLSAIEKGTLPGWEFSRSGNYYGGVQTYLDTAVLVPVLGVVFVSQHFSVLQTKMWVALHTGDLLHILRLLNGLCALLLIAGGYIYFVRRKIPAELAFVLILFVALLLSNVFVIEFLHTAKVWTFYTLAAVLASSLFIAEQYYLSKKGEPFLPTPVYVGILSWLSALLFFQNYIGAFAVLIIGLYALILQHIRFYDIWLHVRKYWYLFILLFVSQISFLYRAVFFNWKSGSFDEIAVVTSDHHAVWLPRLLNPLRFSVLGDPLVVFLFFAGIVGAAVLLWRGRYTLRSLNRRYLLIACVHPFIIYLFFHVAVGFSSAPRYGLMLTIACAFSAAILISECALWARGASLALAAALFVVLNIQAISLYSQPSSEVDLLRIIETRYNTPNHVFIEEESALRLTLPVNADSLDLLDDKRKAMSRFAFMLEHKDEVKRAVTFKPLTLIAYTDEEFQDAFSRFSAEGKQVWTISQDCSRTCASEDTAAGTCFMVGKNVCGALAHEVNLLPAYLEARQLGALYTVRRVH